MRDIPSFDGYIAHAIATGATDTRAPAKIAAARINAAKARAALAEKRVQE